MSSKEEAEVAKAKAELKKVGKKLRKQQREDTDRFIRELEKEGEKEDGKASRRDS